MARTKLGDVFVDMKRVSRLKERVMFQLREMGRIGIQRCMLRGKNQHYTLTELNIALRQLEDEGLIRVRKLEQERGTPPIVYYDNSGACGLAAPRDNVLKFRSPKVVTLMDIVAYLDKRWAHGATQTELTHRYESRLPWGELRQLLWRGVKEGRIDYGVYDRGSKRISRFWAKGKRPDWRSYKFLKAS